MLASLLLLLSSAGVARAHDGHGDTGLELAKTATEISMAPTLSVSLSPVPPAAIPGDHLIYHATVTDAGGTVAIAGDFVARNDTDQAKTVSSWYDAIAVSASSGHTDWERGVGADERCRGPERGWGHQDSLSPSSEPPHWKGCSAYAVAAAAASGYRAVDPGPTSPRVLDLAATPLAADGVAYGSQPDHMIGTVIAPHRVATWHYVATLQLASADAATLLNPLITRAAANILHIEITPSREPGSQHNYASADLTSLLRDGSGQAGGDGESARRGDAEHGECGPAPEGRDGRADGRDDRDDGCGSPHAADLQASSVHVTILPPSGAPITFTPTDTPALAALAPGASVQVSTPYSVPAPGARRPDQTDAVYLAQLGRLDGSSLTARASATATSPIVGVVGATAQPVSTTEHLPRLQLTKSGPVSIDASTTATYGLALRNTGGATASTIALSDRFPGGATGTIAGSPTTLDPGASAQATSQFAIPDGHGRASLTDTAEVSWQDANHNAYGSLVSTFTSLINEANQPPIAGTASATVEQKQTLTLPVAELLRHDSLAFPSQPGETLTITAVTATPGTHGTVSLANGIVSYTPDPSYTGPARFTYTVCNNGTTAGRSDPKCATGVVNVAVTISPVGRPTADSQHLTTPENISVPIHLSGSDPAGSTLTFAVDLAPQHGTLSGNAPNLTYTPSDTFTGVDTFTYTASSGQAVSPPATVTLTITAVNQHPNAGTVKFSLQQASQATGGPLTLYATERLNQSIAKVTFPNGVPKVDSAFVSGLPQQGPDSAIFAPDGNLLVSNPDAGTISLVNPVTGLILNPQINTTLLPDVADLALDPSGRAVWAISLGHSGTDAISRISLDNGTVDARNPDGIVGVGGIAFDDAGKRLFVSGSDGTGTINEVSPTDGHVLRSIDVTGFPDSITFDPSTRHLFASRCNDLPPGQGTNAHALCEIDIGTDSAPTLRLVGLREPQGDTPDGIAADGKGAIYIARDLCCIDRLDLATNSIFPVAQVPNADDITPLIGLGAPPPPAVLRFPASDLISVSTPGPPDESTQNLIITSVTPTATTHGTVSLADGTITYTPDPSYTGPADFSYQICDDGTSAGKPDPKCATGAVEVTIVANQAPSATSQLVTTPENTPVGVRLAGNDPGGAALTFGIAQGPQHGLLSGTAPGVTYTPTKDFFGGDSFTFTASNGKATSPPATVTLVVSAVNQAPTAGDVSASTQEGAPLSVPAASILRSDTPGPRNEADQTLTITAVNTTATTHGTVTLVNGQVTYTPDASFSGVASFEYTVCDNGATNGKPDPKCATGKVNVTVKATAPPVVRDDTTSTQEGQVVTVNVLANDDPGSGQLDPSTLTVSSTSSLGKATVSGAAILYTPNPGASGVDSFNYRVCNTDGACGQATVTVTITSAPKPPTAQDDSYTVAANGSLQVPAPGILGNDMNPNAGDSLHVELVQGPSAGSLLVRADGSFDYTPATSFSGYDHFTYRAVDFAGQASAPVTVTLTVVGPPGPPTADGGSYSVEQGRVLDVTAPGVLANDTAPDPNAKLTAHLESDATDGSLLLRPDGSFSYAPAPGFIGSDSFTYRARDAQGRSSDPATVVITVTPGSLPPPGVSAITPSDGARITAPTPITATITAGTGDTIARWTVTGEDLDGGGPFPIASGHGTPPPTLGTFDPTTLHNGTYRIRIQAVSVKGETTTVVSTAVVAGSMKLGAYSTTYDDMNATIGGVPFSVNRTYDTTDRRDGDFGRGWTIGFSNYRATPNGRLGQSGWSATTAGFPFPQTTFATNVPHFVTVTAPDGSEQVFDFRPAPSSPILQLTTPTFVPQPGTGTTGTLQDADPPVLALGGGSIRTFLTGEVYDPQRFVLTKRDGTILVIDRSAGLVSLTDRHGNEYRVTPSGIRSNAGTASLEVVRDGAGHITSITGPGSRHLAYTYDASGQLASFTGLNGASDHFVYDADGRLLRVDGPQGTRLRTLGYDDRGRVTSITDAEGHTVHVSTDLSTTSEITTSPSGRLNTVLTYNSAGQLASQDQVYDGRSHITSYGYDSDGRMVHTTSPSGATMLQTYDAAGDITSKTTPNGGQWQYEYNNFGEMTRTISPAGVTVESATYDAFGDQTSTTTADVGATSYTYDATGLLTKAQDPSGTTTYEYDAEGQPTRVTDPAGGVTTYGYDAQGDITTVTSPSGGVTRYQYDALGALTRLTDPQGGVRTYTFDDLGNMTAQTDTAGRLTSFVTDSEGRVLSMTDPAGGITTSHYDADGLLTSRRYPDGSQTDIVSDPTGKPVQVATADTVVDQTYDAAGNLASQRTSGRSTANLPDVTLTFGHDPDGNLTTLTGPDGTTAYNYDGQDRLVGIRSPSGGQFTAQYNRSDRLTQLTRPNGVSDRLTYFNGYLTSRESTLSTSVLSRADYTIDAVGRRTVETTLDGTSTFTHSVDGLLTGASYPSASTLSNDSFSYNAAGDRTAWAGSPASSVTYDRGSELASDGRYTYTYDTLGRLIRREDRSSHAITVYAWNGAGELTSVTQPDGSRTAYGYDGFGRRVEVAGGGKTLHYVYVGWNLDLTYDGTRLDTSYTAGPFPDTVYEIRRGGASYYPLFDGSGSITGLTDSGGKVVSSTRYSAFGFAKSSGATDPGYTFTGYQSDGGTGLYYARSRYYDPTTGRFLSPDSAPTLAPYSYGNNEPLELTDPLGREATSEKIQVECRAGWSPAQKAAAVQKINALQRAAQAGKLIVTKGAARNGAITRGFRAAQSLGAGVDADHLIELVLGGQDVLDNLWPLDSTVNRSVGSQIGKAVRSLSSGTPIQEVTRVGC